MTMFLRLNLENIFTHYVNEVLTNSFKHAYIGKKNREINVLFKQNMNTCELQITDNGVGILEKHHNKLSQSIGMT